MIIKPIPGLELNSRRALLCVVELLIFVYFHITHLRLLGLALAARWFSASYAVS